MKKKQTKQYRRLRYARKIAEGWKGITIFVPKEIYDDLMAFKNMRMIEWRAKQS